MAKTFLRSGNLDTVLALGENGQPVWTSALQIRETLRLRRQTTLANCLAIPQVNERGDRLDWYAPFTGKVKSWLGASDHERRQALELLTLNQQDLQALSLRARDAENPAMRLFGALLSKTLQFPDQQYVYLVDGKPVITFWGFVDPQARSRDDALACLRDSLEDALPPLLPEPPAPAPLVVAPVIAPLIEVPPAAAQPVIEPEPEAEEPAVEVIAEAAPEPLPEPVSPPRRAFAVRPLMLLLPVAALVAAGVAYWLHSAPQPAAISVADVPVPVSKPPAVMVKAEKLAATLPQTAATVVAAAPVATPVAPPEVVAEHTEPAKADDLVMTTEDARVGSVKFINGTWRVTLRQTNLPTGKPPSLRYQIRNGKGTATITQGDNIRCKADVTAAMTTAGSMEVRSRYTATCSDKSRYRMPELVCKAGDGIASCTAQYGADQVFPLTIKRESK
ncbi:SrfA family protein [Pantoea sp. DY-15]|uniref:SrfA family protein n=1 Tax=unclassified Pantoea TaxID=2630326 RepID=UPI001C96E432|nr:SrfA family protein [Pantoea sp. DY-5]MBY4887263.1 SrfA family protein [Pantoea sp. DY-15]